MNKLLSASIVAIMLLSLAGCGRGEATSFGKSQTNPSDTVINTADSLEDIGSTADSSTNLTSDIMQPSSSKAGLSETANTSTPEVTAVSETATEPVSITELNDSTSEAPHEHHYAKTTVKPTCTKEGYNLYTCSCGDEYTESLGLAEHSYEESTISATCTEEGYTLHVCSVCGKQYTSDTVTAYGHRWSNWTRVKEPTIYDEGEDRRECTVCGAEETSSVERIKDLNACASAVVDIVNSERAKEGLSALTVRDDLSEYAFLRSGEIATNFAHERPDGSDPLRYVMDLGDIYCSGENVASGHKSPEEVMNGWMNSPGHRSNILNATFSYIGVGCYEANGRLYWTQIFAG